MSLNKSRECKNSYIRKLFSSLNHYAVSDLLVVVLTQMLYCIDVVAYNDAHLFHIQTHHFVIYFYGFWPLISGFLAI